MNRLRGLTALVAAALLAGACGSSAAPTASAPTVSAAPSVTAFDMSSVQGSVALVKTDGTFVTTDGASEGTLAGTGFVVSSCGDGCSLLVTNNHVVTGGAFWSVTIGTSTTSIPASLVAASECDDLALLTVQGTFPPLTLAATVPSVTTPIFVAGHPNGDAYTITNGIIAKGPYASDTSWASVTQELQITAQTFPGNSGSPVLVSAGNVVGIEYADGGPGSSIQGESFAISASEAATVIEKLKSGKDPDEYYLGINSAAASNNTGIDVVSVAPGSPADKAGIKAGDEMTNLNGTAVGLDGSKATYCSVLRSHPNATDTLSVVVQRGSETLTGEINGTPLAVTGTSASPTATGNGGGGADAIASLKALVPSAIASTCTPNTQSPATGALASLQCAATGINGIFYDNFPDLTALASDYASWVSTAKAKANETASCDSGAWDVPYTTTFSDGRKFTGAGYRLLCWKAASGAYLVQEDPIGMMDIVMVATDGNQAKLNKWWNGNTTETDPEPAQ